MTSLIVTAMSAALALVSLGGGAYEYLVVDPFWPRRPDIVHPGGGGILRRRFWIPAHSAFELCLIAALILCWSVPEVRTALVAALASHAILRIWSALDFIPKALAFERQDPADVDMVAARRWTRRSVGRLPLDLVTCSAMLTALVLLARLGH